MKRRCSTGILLTLILLSITFRCADHFVEFQQNLELSVTLVFDAVLPAEMITVDSHDPQTSPDSQHLLGIEYAPLSSRDAQAWFCRPWTLQFVQAHACTVPVKHNFSIWHLRNLARPLKRTLPTSQAPKSNSLRTAVMILSKVSFHLRSHHQHAHGALHGFFHSFEEQMHMDREHNL